MNQAVENRTIIAESRVEPASWALAKLRFGGILRSVSTAWEVLAAARRVAAAIELRRMPSTGDLTVLGIEDPTPVRRYIGR